MAGLNYGYLLNDPNWLEFIAALPIGNENGPDPTSVFDDAIRKDKIPPMLIVFPNGMASSMWCDSKDGKVRMEQVVIQELLPLVDRDFRTIGKREGRVIEGFSMGGYGAARLGFKYSELFGTVSILAGAPLDLEFKGPRAVGNPKERERILQNTFGGDIDYYNSQSPLTLAEKYSTTVKDKARVRMAVGTRDNTADLNRGKIKWDILLYSKWFSCIEGIATEPGSVGIQIPSNAASLFAHSVNPSRKSSTGVLPSPTIGRCTLKVLRGQAARRHAQTCRAKESHFPVGETSAATPTARRQIVRCLPNYPSPQSSHKPRQPRCRKVRDDESAPNADR